MATALSPLDRPKQLTETRCRIALVGFGTVGSAVARLLHARRDDHSLRLTHVCNRDIARKKVNWISPDVRWTENIRRSARIQCRHHRRADGWSGAGP